MNTLRLMNEEHDCNFAYWWGNINYSTYSGYSCFLIDFILIFDVNLLRLDWIYKIFLLGFIVTTAVHFRRQIFGSVKN